MKIKISKAQWKYLGKTAGWLHETCMYCQKPLTLTKDNKCTSCGAYQKETQQELPIRLRDPKKTITNKNPMGNPNYKKPSSLDTRKMMPQLKAQYKWILPDDKVKILTKIFDAIPGHPNNPDRITELSKEIRDEAMGTMYIQVYFNSNGNDMTVERYYENEMQQDMYGQSKNIPINWDNPSETIKSILSQMQDFKHN